MMMNLLKHILLISLVITGNFYGAHLSTLPYPLLHYADIEWWLPHNLPPKLHITLRYFDLGTIWENFSHKTLQEKRNIRKEYQQDKKNLMQAKNKLFSKNEFSRLFHKEQANNERYVLKGIDIISTHPEFSDQYVLNTSEMHLSGTPTNITKFKTIFEFNNPYETKIIKTRRGKKIVPKYHWYIIAKPESNIINFRNKLCKHPFFKQFPEMRKYDYLPHITLGKIKSIADVDQFLSAIRKTNLRLTQEPIERKSFKFENIERFHPNNHKIYLLLQRAHKANMIFMLVIGWKTPLGKLLKNIVKVFPDQQKVWHTQITKRIPEYLIPLPLKHFKLFHPNYLG